MGGAKFGMDKGKTTDDGRIRFGNDVMSVISYWESCCDELKEEEGRHDGNMRNIK